MRAAARSSAPRPATPPFDAPPHRSGAARVVRVLVVDDSDLYRAGLVRAINATADLELVADVGDGTAAVAAARTLLPDAVLIDYRMPDLDGLSAATIMRAERPDLRIVLMSAHREELFARLARDPRPFYGLPCDVVADKAASRRELLDHVRAHSWTSHPGRGASPAGA